MSASSSDAIVRRLGYDPKALADDVRAIPPNPLAIATVQQSRTRCSVISEHGACTEFVAYMDTYQDAGLCVLHARAIADLPDSIAKRQAQTEMVALTLVNMTEEAIRTIGRIMVDEDVPAAVRLRAAETVLDRTGFVKSAHVEVAEAEPLHEATAGDMVRERLRRLASTAENVVPFARTEDEDTAEDTN